MHRALHRAVEIEGHAYEAGWRRQPLLPHAVRVTTGKTDWAAVIEGFGKTVACCRRVAPMATGP